MFLMTTSYTLPNRSAELARTSSGAMGWIQPVAYEGNIGPLTDCVNTGGASEVNLMSVGTTVESLQQKYQRKMCMVFDGGGAYIFKETEVLSSKNYDDRFVISSGHHVSKQQRGHRIQQTCTMCRSTDRKVRSNHGTSLMQWALMFT